jgi:hypothetical protein
MKSKTTLVVLILFGISAIVYGYRVLVLGYPPIPTPQVKAWDVSAEVFFAPQNRGPVTVRMCLPRNGSDKLVIDERLTSGPLALTVADERDCRVAIWSGTTEGPEEQVTYRATIVIRQRKAEPDTQPVMEQADLRALDPRSREAVDAVALPWRRLDSTQRLAAVLTALRGDSRSANLPEQQAVAALKARYGDAGALLFLSQSAGLPSRIAAGLVLREGISATTVRWVEVWTGKRWEAVDPAAAAPFPPEEATLSLATGNLPTLSVSGATVSDARWNLSRQIVSPWKLHLEPVLHQGGLLARWSLFSLPTEFQGTFRVLLLIPIGALMISILRNVVGFPTFGIFMPVLMALAFRATGIFYGIAIFAGVVFIGYAVRRALNRLRLLLVPRLATILTLVVFCFAFLAVAGSKLGLRSMMAVGLLPFVILTMTVERFYVLIEESGLKQALLTAAGSAAVAVLTYRVLEIERLQLLFFVFPELLFAVGACQIILGRYTGYRVSEYIRFRALRKSS